MSVFGSYARYYDLLYKDKDYAGECRFVASLIRKHAPHALNVLELGCGTGMHACLLAEDGFNLLGVDLSAEMLERGRERLSGMDQGIRDRLSFSLGNVCTFRTERRFDAVISLFHVVSYQSVNDDLRSMFETAAAHLTVGGVFIFDFWFAPAVLTERPSVRVRRIDTDDLSITRIAEPVMLANLSCVDVNYEVFIRDKAADSTVSLRETHRMRYLLPTEIEMLAKYAGLRVLGSCEWLTGSEPGSDTWGVCSVLGK